MPTHVIKIKLSVDIVILEDGTEYRAFAPAFKGLHVFGINEKDALENAKDAVVANVESLLKHNEPIPCCQIIDEDMLPNKIEKTNIHRENIPIELLSVT